MAIIIDTKRHKDFLEIIVTGSYDLNQAINKFSQIYLYCNIAGLQKVLIDYRELQKNTGDTEKYLFGAGIADSYNNYLSSGGYELQFAFLAPTVTPYEPGFEIAQQAGLPIELFDNYNKALKWLSIESPPGS